MPKLKNVHEFRDPIHTFIQVSSNERKVIDSQPFQRLRYLHQLGPTFFLYPGATHRRFEHSLGVMHLASYVYDVITDVDNLHPSVKHIIPSDKHMLHYWRQVVRMAALCHDIGHLPFSHAAECRLPKGVKHENFTIEIITCPDMKPIWDDMKVDPNDVAKIAVDAGKYKAYYERLNKASDRNLSYSSWEAILSEIVVGDGFGVDRMDYLLRDSLHVGVSYGKFDQHRLINTLRILPKSNDDSAEPFLGIEDGGLQSAEALIWARHFMFTQVYNHQVRRAYDIHLQDFVKEYYADGQFPTKLDEFLDLTENELLMFIKDAAKHPDNRAHEPARRIIQRDHFKLLYQINSRDQDVVLEATEAIYHAACEKFGKKHVRFDSPAKEGKAIDFPVLTKDDRISSSIDESPTLMKIPSIKLQYVLIDKELRAEGIRWLEQNRQKILEDFKAKKQEEAEENG
jgi:hypothetical protein